MKYLFIVLFAFITVGCMDSAFILPSEMEEAKSKCESKGKLKHVMVYMEKMMPDNKHMSYAKAVCNNKESFHIRHSRE